MCFSVNCSRFHKDLSFDFCCVRDNVIRGRGRFKGRVSAGFTVGPFSRGMAGETEAGPGRERCSSQNQLNEQ